ncbi:hypothetical protein IK146_01455 [Candidatus Saccharibacteria bacterium]|nr:hypothetical protein [Candidatus Saccharibacteria bacterium]
MDNDNISKIPVSELTPENINSLKGGSGSTKPARKEKTTNKEAIHHRLLLLIVGAILLIGVVVALYFIFRKPTVDTTVDDGEESTEIVWAPSEGSEDPGQDYVNDKQSTIDNPDATTDEKLDAQLSIANLYSVTGAYEEAESLLNGINRDALTYRQLFNLYSAYAYLYEHSGDETAYDTYSNLVEDILKVYWDEETTETKESTGE